MLTRVVLALTPPELRKRLREALSADRDLVVEATSNHDRLWQRLRRAPTDCIVISETLVPPPAPDTLALYRDLPDAPAVFVVTEEDDPEGQAELLAAGCEAVLYAGLPSETLCGVLAAVLDRRRQAAADDWASMRSPDVPRLADFVSKSPAMHAFMRVVERVSRSDSSLLILGETGVGKERLARAIHAQSDRADGPFVAVNCGALPEALLESELFGHEQGAFTGATRSRRGCFEMAHRGTIFLDEVAEMPGHLQVKLLRVLQDHAIQRVGAERGLRVDVRVMAATNRSIDAEVESGAFRQDLYYRLGVVSLIIPPLRARKADIPELVDSYVSFLRPRIGCEVYGIEETALAALEQYAWPGNVRELINVIERAMLLCDNAEIGLDDLPAAIAGGTASHDALALSETDEPILPAAWMDLPLKALRERVLDDVERVYLTHLLRATRGRVGETAARAGLEPRSLYGKMKRLGLRKEDFR